jgi:hypothetical protein
MRSQRLVAAACLTIAAQLARAQVPGETLETGVLTIQRPTLHSLGFELDITGDTNRNAVVTVTYRKLADVQWRQALPMMRLQNEVIAASRLQPFAYTAPNAFAGSILNLEPDTEYECRFSASDPDGVKGEQVRVARVRTRAEPLPASGGRIFHVYPPDPAPNADARQEPAFVGLLAAYYEGSSHGDSYNSYPPRVRPGDVILVHGGLYKDDWRHYGGLLPGQVGLGTVVSGTYFLTQPGEPARPIVIKAAGDGEPIFDGDGAAVLFNVMAASHNYFEGITFRNADVAIQAGDKRIAGASGIVVKSSRFEAVGRGIFTDWAGSQDFYIADNVFVGRNPPGRLLGWMGKTWERFPGFPHPVVFG